MKEVKNNKPTHCQKQTQNIAKEEVLRNQPHPHKTKKEKSGKKP
jgi:hypothetical protein